MNFFEHLELIALIRADFDGEHEKCLAYDRGRCQSDLVPSGVCKRENCPILWE